MAGGTGVNNNVNTKPDVTNFNLVGVGWFDDVADLPDAADYPWTIVGAIDDEVARLYFSNGVAWLPLAFVSDTEE